MNIIGFLKEIFFDGRLKLCGKGRQNGKIIAGEESKSIYFLHSQWPSKFYSMLTVPKLYLKKETDLYDLELASHPVICGFCAKDEKDTNIHHQGM